MTIKPHESTQPAKGYSVGADSKTAPVTAYLSVYRVHQCYGGHEEGGWWYDAYEHVGPSFPFRAEQDYEVSIIDDDTAVNDNVQTWTNDDGELCCWHATGLPRVTDETTRVRLQSAWLHFVELYGEPGTTHRFSCAQREDDYAFVYELTLGSMEQRQRPRYC